MTSGLSHVLEKRDDLSSVEEERECGRSRSGGFPWLAVASAKEATADPQNGALENAPLLVFCRRLGLTWIVRNQLKASLVGDLAFERREG